MTKLLADRPEHAWALKLDRGGWRTILSLPGVCEALGEPCPEWAWWLCEHAIAVAEGSPAALLEALTRAEGDGDGAPIDSDHAELGEALDLCVVVGPAEDGEVRITPTAFGFAVGVLHQQRGNEDDDVQDTEDDSKLDGLATDEGEAHEGLRGSVGLVLESVDRVIRRAEQLHHEGAAFRDALVQALSEHPGPPRVATACRVVWSLAMEPRDDIGHARALLAVIDGLVPTAGPVARPALTEAGTAAEAIVRLGTRRGRGGA